MRREELADLTAFLAVAEERSFTRAAARLGTSQSALSHTVRRLEARLGLRLLTRTTRSVAPTEAGARLFERLGPALAEVETTLDVARAFRDRPAGTLRLNVPANVARGEVRTLAEASAAGADIRAIASPAEAVTIARATATRCS